MRHAMAKIPVTIVTGFLGAGKTTLIRHVLENAAGRRLALIINEFGDVGVDGAILKSCGIDSCPEENIVELANGCLCCTVADDFIPAIEALLARVAAARTHHHRNLRTGAAQAAGEGVRLAGDPHPPDRRRRDRGGRRRGRRRRPLRRRSRRNWPPSAPPTARSITKTRSRRSIEDQLLCADLVVLNKADLLTADAAQRVAAEIRAAVPRAVKIVETREGRIDPAVLLGLAAAVEDDLAQRPSHHDAEEGHDHDDFESFVVDIPRDLRSGRPADAPRRVAEQFDVLRMKGFVEVVGQADAAAGPGRRPALPAAVRPALGAGR